MTFDLDEEMSSSVLVKLWVTIRGFSYASAIVDDYRHSQTKRKKSLRNELKNKAKEVKSVK